MCRHLNTVAGTMKVERVKYNGHASHVSISIQFMTTARKQRDADSPPPPPSPHGIAVSVCRHEHPQPGPFRNNDRPGQLRLKWISAGKRAMKVNTGARRRRCVRVYSSAHTSIRADDFPNTIRKRDLVNVISRGENFSLLKMPFKAVHRHSVSFTYEKVLARARIFSLCDILVERTWLWCHEMM